MAPVSARAQFAAVTRMRWQMFLHSLRTRRGGFEVGARIFMRTFFAIIGLGIGSGLGFVSYQIASGHSLRLLAAALWPVFLVWQFAPVAVASFQENPDLSIFLRFPIAFRSYAVFYVLFGLFDIGSIIGGIALTGIFIGTSIAQPGLIPWTALSLLLFAAFNIFLTRMVFSWIDRWLAQRKTREILGIIFLFLMLGGQLLNPAFYPRHNRQVSSSSLMHAIHLAEHFQNGLPPGLAANAMQHAHHHRPIHAVIDLFVLTLYAIVVAAGLVVRLRAQYRGESLGEAPGRVAKAQRPIHRTSWFEGSGPVAAVIEKEVRYLMRSGVMLYGFLAPLIMVFLFSNGSHISRVSAFGAQFALPIGVAYSFLGLTRFVYNTFGGESAGIQLYFLSPTPFSKIVIAKNIVHLFIFFIELLLVCAILIWRVGLPGPQMLAITFSWLLFAVPLQLAIGNLLSIFMAYRMNMTRMGREQGAAANGFLSLLIQALIFAIGAGVYFLCAWSAHLALAAPILLLFAVASTIFWWQTTARAGSLIEARKDTLIPTLYKAD